jgi:hypothetical protein
MKKFGALAVMFFGVTGLSLAADVTGWVTDAACGSKGRFGAEHKACAQKCAAKGMDLVLVTDDAKVIKIHNKDAVSSHVGDRVTATGKVDGDSIHVDSVKPAN